MKEKDTLFAKWLAGNITPDELQELQKEHDLSKLEQVLKRQKEFDMTTRSDEVMWQDFEKRVAKSGKPKENRNDKVRNNFIIGFITICIFAIGAWLYFGKTPNSPKKIETPPAQTEELRYADGTKIQISPNSSIEYDEEKWMTQRTINLEGQAFFEVEKGSPFIVKTKAGEIEVFGTKFDIWEIDGLMNVQCFEGSVKVTSGGVSKILTANQQVFVNENKLEKVETMELNEPDWLQGQRIYQKVPLRGVLKDIERFYGVKIDVTAVSIDNDFGGVIPTNDFDKALNYLTKSLNWTYEIKDKTVYFNGNSE